MEVIEDLRYPIGKPGLPNADRTAARAHHIETIGRLPERLKDAVAKLDDRQLNTPYREGGWTLRQVVHHVADSHSNALIRTKLALTEDWPTIKPYDEGAWAELADARSLPVEPSLSLLTALHARWVAVLQSLNEQQFERGYVHPAMKENGGRQSLNDMLALYDWHSRHHTAHILNLRYAKGW